MDQTSVWVKDNQNKSFFKPDWKDLLINILSAKVFSIILILYLNVLKSIMRKYFGLLEQTLFYRQFFSSLYMYISHNHEYVNKSLKVPITPKTD